MVTSGEGSKREEKKMSFPISLNEYIYFFDHFQNYDLAESSKRKNEITVLDIF